MISITVLDYGYPLVSKFIFKAENWSGSQEKLYEQVIQEIVDVRLCVCGAVCSFFSSRSERSTFVSVDNEDGMRKFWLFFLFSISSLWQLVRSSSLGLARHLTIFSWSIWPSLCWPCIRGWRRRVSSSWSSLKSTKSSAHTWRRYGPKNQRQLRKQIEVMIWSHFKHFKLNVFSNFLTWSEARDKIPLFVSVRNGTGFPVPGEDVRYFLLNRSVTYVQTIRRTIFAISISMAIRNSSHLSNKFSNASIAIS